MKLRESIEMGSFRGTSSQMDKILSEMREKFTGSSYHIFDRNCNTFADEFLKRLIGVGAPAYVNRMAYMGSFFSCFLPENLNQDPTQQQQTSGGAYGGSSNTSGGVYRSGSSYSTQPTRAFSGTSGTKLGNLYILHDDFKRLYCELLYLRFYSTRRGWIECSGYNNAWEWQ